MCFIGKIEYRVTEANLMDRLTIDMRAVSRGIQQNCRWKNLTLYIILYSETVILFSNVSDMFKVAAVFIKNW